MNAREGSIAKVQSMRAFMNICDSSQGELMSQSDLLGAQNNKCTNYCQIDPNCHLPYTVFFHWVWSLVSASSLPSDTSDSYQVLVACRLFRDSFQVLVFGTKYFRVSVDQLRTL